MKYNNVFWFLIDGMSPDYLKTCGNDSVEENFFDEILYKGSVFSNVATTAAGTHTSMHSIFSSLMPSCNGASGWGKEALQNFKQEIYTITDIFKVNGYRTFRYGDADGERAVPMSGFDVWESSGFKISELLNSTDMCATERREKFIAEVNECQDRKFVYHHNLLLHELNGKMGKMWTTDGYIKNIKFAATEFEKLYKSYSITENDLVIISSDHGVILDIPWQEDGIKNGERHYEQSVKAFWCVCGMGIPNKVLKKRISALDIAPTLLKILFNFDLNHQGHSQDRYLFDDRYIPLPCYREKGSYCVSEKDKNPLSSDVYYVWDNNWKYTYGERDSRCEWLIDLNKNRDYEVNLKSIYPQKVDYFKELIDRNIKEINIERFLEEDRKNLLIPKNEIEKMFSIVIERYIDYEDWKALLDIAGPYYEIVYLKEDNTIPFEYRNHYKIRKMCSNQKRDRIIEECKGKWVIFTKKSYYNEYFLSDLYRYIYTNEECTKIRGRGFVAIKKHSGGNGRLLKYEWKERRVNFRRTNNRICKVISKLRFLSKCER